MYDDSAKRNLKERLSSLAEFQISCLIHAMSLPNVKKIVYSTCSIHEEENEHVIERVLGIKTDFQLCPFPEAFHSLPGYDKSGMLRTDPKVDETNGFFVALLSRKTEE